MLYSSGSEIKKQEQSFRHKFELLLASTTTDPFGRLFRDHFDQTLVISLVIVIGRFAYSIGRF